MVDLTGNAIKIVFAVHPAPGLEDLPEIDQPAALFLVEFGKLHKYPNPLIWRTLPDMHLKSNAIGVNRCISICYPHLSAETQALNQQSTADYASGKSKIFRCHQGAQANRY
jgi:hypothetical protein